MNSLTFIIYLILIPVDYMLFFEDNGKPGRHGLIPSLNEWKMMGIIWKKINGND